MQPRPTGLDQSAGKLAGTHAVRRGSACAQGVLALLFNTVVLAMVVTIILS